MLVQIGRYLATREAHGTYSHSSTLSVGSRLRSFATFYGSRPIEAIDWHDVEAWMTSLSEKKPQTRSSYLSALRKFFRWLIREGQLDVNPAADIESMRRPRAVPRSSGSWSAWASAARKSPGSAGSTTTR